MNAQSKSKRTQNHKGGLLISTFWGGYSFDEGVKLYLKERWDPYFNKVWRDLDPAVPGFPDRL